MKICIVCTNLEKARDLYSQHRTDQNILFELRIDADPNLLELINEVPSDRIVLTLRSKDEGGNHPHHIKLQDLLNKKVKYIDLEILRDKGIIQQILSKQMDYQAENLIISYHNFDQSYLDGFEIFESNLRHIKHQLTDNCVLKFVGNPQETLEALKLVIHKRDTYPRHIFLGTKRIADILRTAGDHLYQEFVFGSTGNLNIIPYQILQKTNENFYNLGLIGRGIENSLSPYIHTIFLNQQNLNGYYHLLEVSKSNDLGELVEILREYQFTGFNITSPFKMDIMKVLDKIDSSAEFMNAVNAVKISKEGLIGYNKDGVGFLKAYKSSLDNNSQVLIVGASGAARAVISTCLNLDKEITLVMRSASRKDEFSQDMLSQIEIIDKIPSTYPGLLVNCSTLGKSSDIKITLPEQITEVIDLNYYQNKTWWDEICNAQNIRYFDGKDMLFHQAVEAFQLWTESNINREKAYTEFSEGL